MEKTACGRGAVPWGGRRRGVRHAPWRSAIFSTSACRGADVAAVCGTCRPTAPPGWSTPCRGADVAAVCGTVFLRLEACPGRRAVGRTSPRCAAPTTERYLAGQGEVPWGGRRRGVRHCR